MIFNKEILLSILDMHCWEENQNQTHCHASLQNCLSLFQMKEISTMMKVELAEYLVQILFNARSDYCIKRFCFYGVKYIPRKRLVLVHYFMQRHRTNVLYKGKLKIQIKICYLQKPKVFFFLKLVEIIILSIILMLDMGLCDKLVQSYAYSLLSSFSLTFL